MKLQRKLSCPATYFCDLVDRFVTALYVALNLQFYKVVGAGFPRESGESG
jgi:hypothetical protein